MSWSDKELFGSLNADGDLISEPVEEHGIEHFQDLEELRSGCYQVRILDKLGKSFGVQNALDVYLASRECAAKDVYRMLSEKYWRKDCKGRFLYENWPEHLPEQAIMIHHMIVRNSWDVFLNSFFVVRLKGFVEEHDFAQLFQKDFLENSGAWI